MGECERALCIDVLWTTKGCLKGRLLVYVLIMLYHKECRDSFGGLGSTQRELLLLCKDECRYLTLWYQSVAKCRRKGPKCWATRRLWKWLNLFLNFFKYKSITSEATFGSSESPWMNLRSNSLTKTWKYWKDRNSGHTACQNAFSSTM